MAEVEVNGTMKEELKEEPESSPVKTKQENTEVEKEPQEAEVKKEPQEAEVKKEPQEAEVKKEPQEAEEKKKPQEAEVKKEPEEMDADDAETNAEPTNLEKQIIRQIEYYFGDINLPRDKFLLEQIKLDDGWIPLEVMLKFQRLANLSKEVDVIVKAVSKSKNGLLEVSEDKKKIRRNPERVLPQQTEERRKELMSRTLYCKGFPLDSQLDNLLEFFQNYGNFESIIMRYYRDKNTKSSQFKGSAFVLFQTKEQAEEFLKIEEVKYGETVLLRLWQNDYLEKKRLERKQKPHKEGAEKQDDQEQETKSFPRGTVLHIKGDFGEISREDLRSQVEEHGGVVAYINYNKGDEEAWVRLQETTAKDLVEKLEDQKMVVKDVSLDVRVLEGEEEEKFLNEAMAEMLKRRQSSRQNFRGKRGRRGGRGGRGGFNNQNRKRKADGADDVPPAKKQGND